MCIPFVHAWIWKITAVLGDEDHSTCDRVGVHVRHRMDGSDVHRVGCERGAHIVLEEI